jgi:hypothetical protein
MRTFTNFPLEQLIERLIALEGKLTEAPPQVKPIINEDPTPLPSDLPSAKKPAPVEVKEVKHSAPVVVKEVKHSAAFTPRHDTILQFAAVELEGKIIKK